MFLFPTLQQIGEIQNSVHSIRQTCSQVPALLEFAMLAILVVTVTRMTFGERCNAKTEVLH